MTFHFTVATIFPEIFSGFLDASLIGKAREKGLMDIEFLNIRDFTKDKHHTVDDSPYGGGAGMVMKAQPIIDLLESVPDTYKIAMTPRGKPLDHQTVFSLGKLDSILILCGRYEGMDERIYDFVDEEISIGDFVLSGGEVAAMCLIESVSRMISGVLGNESSSYDDSFCKGLLEYPQYTRPSNVDGKSVPDVLLSGDHGMIERWRHEKALELTAKSRPDLLGKIDLCEDDKAFLNKIMVTSNE